MNVRGWFCMRVCYFGSYHLSTAVNADLERGCVSVPEAKLAALRAMLQFTGGSHTRL